MKAKKTAALLLAMLMLAACGEPADTPSDQDAQTTAASIEETTAAETRIEPNLPDISFDGTDFTHLGTGGSSVYQVYYATSDLWTEGESGEPFNDAIYKRNRAVEEKYDIVIGLVSDENTYTKMQQMVNSNDCIYDAVWTYQFSMYQAALQGWLTDFNTIPHIDLSSKWWDQNIGKDMGFYGKVYTMTGDISTRDDACTIMTYFNKFLIEQYKLTSPYELVNTNQWTIDRFIEMTKAVSEDVDGNGSLERGDVFGMLSENALNHRIFVGLGGTYFEHDGDGDYFFTITEEQNIDRMNKALELLNLENHVSNMNRWESGDNVFQAGRQLFTQDKFLFHLSLPLVIDEFRDMKNEFGIVPLPKYDTQQDRYYSVLDANVPLLAVMTNTPDIEKTGVILEALAAESMYTVTPEYNETLLKRKYTRDTESAAMLDVISQSRTFDVMGMINWGGIVNVGNSAYEKGNSVNISDYEKLLKAAQKLLEKDLKKFREME